MLNDVLEVLQPVANLQKNRKFTFSLLGILVLLVVVTFFNMLSHWYNDFAAVNVKPAKQKNVLAADDTSQLIADLPNQHLFGLSLAADDFLPITNLQLHLTGLIKDPNSDKSQAIISEANKTGKIYSVGDELTAGIKIYAINADGIVLEHAGHLEKLPLLRAQLTFEDKPKTIWGENPVA